MRVTKSGGTSVGTGGRLAGEAEFVDTRLEEEPFVAEAKDVSEALRKLHSEMVGKEAA